MHLCNLIAQAVLKYLEVEDAGIIPGFESDILPDAATNEPRTPVPPELILCFPAVDAFI